MKSMTARIAESIKILEEYEYDAIHIEDFLRLIAMTYEEYVPSEIVEVATEKLYTGNSKSLQERTAITISELDSIATENQYDDIQSYLYAVIDCVKEYLPDDINHKLLDIT